MNAYEHAATLGREWTASTVAALNELVELQRDRCLQRYEAGLAEMMKPVAAGSLAELMEGQRERMTRWWQDELEFTRSSIAIVERAQTEIRAAWEAHAAGEPAASIAPAAAAQPVAVPKATPAAVEPTAPAAPDSAPERPEEAAAPIFEIYRDRAGEFRFRLRHPDGGNLLASEGYKSRSGAQNGIASVMKNAALEARYERTETASGQPRFNLKAGNYQVIGVSRMYDSEVEMEGDIAFLMRHAAAAAVDDQTEQGAS